MPQFEFHVSSAARQKYKFDLGLFALDGNVLIADFAAAREFAAALSAERTTPVPASDINAMGLLDEVLHMLVRRYEEKNPGVMAKALAHIESNIGTSKLDAALLAFVEQFPPLAVYRGELSAQAYLNGSTDGRLNAHIALEEMIFLHVTNLNPALTPYMELFDDAPLKKGAPYGEVLEHVYYFFNLQPGFGAGSETLLALLRAPAINAPHSLLAQIEYLLQRWGAVLGWDFVNRLMRGLDFVREDARYFMARQGGWQSKSQSEGVPEFSGYPEYERFSPDKEWMPRLVLIAKNAYVWLDQLSRQYGREITRLDQVPDEELALLAQRGFSGLWLIGLWERSTASKEIKQRMGQADAVASAYSLYDYDIAYELGGWDALNNLRWRAWQAGLRLAADMVPNHMGIDSKWVIEHPDWFLSLPLFALPQLRIQQRRPFTRFAGGHYSGRPLLQPLRCGSGFQAR
jgi:hypothetical protein